MKSLVPNYSCLQNPWLGGYRPQIPVLSVLCPQLNLLNPPGKKFLGTPLLQHILKWCCMLFLIRERKKSLSWLKPGAPQKIVTSSPTVNPTFSSIIWQNISAISHFQNSKCQFPLFSVKKILFYFTNSKYILSWPRQQKKGEKHW